jgi:FdrA protein
MPIIKTQIRQGAYYDSVVLMQLQKSLLALPGVIDAGVVMATDANKELLQQNNLMAAEAMSARAEDLLIAVSARDDSAAQSALEQIDELLKHNRVGADETYRPKSLDSAVQMLPEAQWVLVSVPGRYAAAVARDALNLGRNVFLYSDNVPLEEEVSLKQTAREKGLLVMGPDCGTAIVGGVGLGFANRVRRGKIGVVGASGTGIQAVTVGIHRLGEGISHAIGTGTNDLKDAVGAITTLQALELLSRDNETQVIVLISKPPSQSVAARVLDLARRSGKPVVVDFIGYSGRDEGNLRFAKTLDHTAELAVTMLNHLDAKNAKKEHERDLASLASSRLNGFMRALYSGGTLAYEAQLILRDYLPAIYSNAPLITNRQLPSPHASREHTVVDLGAEEFMVGRLHPMIDNDLRIRRLKQEAEDPKVSVILLDVVLGYGAHPDPASELAPAIADARASVARNGRMLEFVAVVIGTDQDPQNYQVQVDRLSQAGARLFETHEAAVRFVGESLGEFKPQVAGLESQVTQGHAVSSSSYPRVFIAGSFAAINAGIESFYESLQAQRAPVIQVDWKPPAGGNEKLMAILEKLKK